MENQTNSTTPQEPSLGELRVRTTFNPSNNSREDLIKQQSASLINLCDDGRKGMRPMNEKYTSEAHRLWSLAQTAYEEACMWAVKAATI